MPNKPLIFIADDAYEVVESLTSDLEAQYQVHYSTQFSEAIDTLKDVRIHATEFADRYAVVIIDLEFKEVGKVHSDAGIKILKEAIKDPFVEPIIFSGQGTEELAAKASEIGMFRYIKKFTRNVKTTTATVKEAVDSACLHRKNIIGMKESISDFHRKMIQLNQAGNITKAQFKHLLQIYKKANLVFDGMLLARGRKQLD